MRFRASLELFLLIAALLLQGIVLYLLEEPHMRLVMGLLLLALIVWSAARVSVMDVVMQDSGRKIEQRRFVRLRSQVARLLDEIRRLNWMAVDAERGFRSQEGAVREMDQIERRLKGLIEEIRSVAGEVRTGTEDVEPAEEDSALT